MREYFVDLTDAFGVEYADREFREAEDKVVFLGTLKLQGRGSDVEVVQPISIVMDHDADGRILGATTHLSQDEGLARAGLSS